MIDLLCEPGMFGGYHSFRAAYWRAQLDVAGFDPDAEQDFAVLKPKVNLIYHDAWIFGSWPNLTVFLKSILDFRDLASVRTHGRAVLWVDWTLPPGGSISLPTGES